MTPLIAAAEILMILISPHSLKAAMTSVDLSAMELGKPALRI
jgi:hypothetical protein